MAKVEGSNPFIRSHCAPAALLQGRCRGVGVLGGGLCSRGRRRPGPRRRSRHRSRRPRVRARVGSSAVSRQAASRHPVWRRCAWARRAAGGASRAGTPRPLRLERAREQVALAAVAVLLLQQRELLAVLDALGERLDRERLAELHERADQRLAFGVLGELGDERAVDLQRVDGEALQVRRARSSRCRSRRSRSARRAP